VSRWRRRLRAAHGGTLVASYEEEHGLGAELLRQKKDVSECCKRLGMVLVGGGEGGHDRHFLQVLSPATQGLEKGSQRQGRGGGQGF
jgi:hypothetical protein